MKFEYDSHSTLFNEVVFVVLQGIFEFLFEIRVENGLKIKLLPFERVFLLIVSSELGNS